jgi:hypothetical protein
VHRLCAALPNLYFVDLDGATRLTTSALVALARLAHLRHVNMRDADYSVSDFAFERLSRFLEQRAPAATSSTTTPARHPPYLPAPLEHELVQTTSPYRRPMRSQQRALAAAAAAAAAAATQRRRQPARRRRRRRRRRHGRRRSPSHTPQNERLAAHARPSSSRLCTRDFPLDSWSACVRLAKRHFAPRDPDLLQRRRDEFAEQTAIMLEELELVAAGGAVLAPMLGERSFEALKALARAFKQQPT